MSDSYQVYRDYRNRLRCWAHLLRKAKGLAESCHQHARIDGQQLHQFMKQLMAPIFQAREGPGQGQRSIMADHQ